MCLGIPMRVKEIDGYNAVCEAKGVERTVSLFMMQDEDVAAGGPVVEMKLLARLGRRMLDHQLAVLLSARVGEAKRRPVSQRRRTDDLVIHTQNLLTVTVLGQTHQPRLGDRGAIIDRNQAAGIHARFTQ